MIIPFANVCQLYTRLPQRLWRLLWSTVARALKQLETVNLVSWCKVTIRRWKIAHGCCFSGVNLVWSLEQTSKLLTSRFHWKNNTTFDGCPEWWRPNISTRPTKKSQKGSTQTKQRKHVMWKRITLNLHISSMLIHVSRSPTHNS